MTIDLSALRKPPAPEGTGDAVDVFLAALAITPGRLTPLVTSPDALIDVRVNVVTEGPQGATRLQFRDNNEMIFEDRGPIAHPGLTLDQIRGRGLRFLIDINVNKAKLPGAVLQTLRHEYGGHVSPWGNYLAPLLDPGPSVAQREETLAKAMKGQLWGGIQHLRMAAGQAERHVILGGAITEILAHHQGPLRDQYLADEAADLENLRKIANDPFLRAATLETAELEESDLPEGPKRPTPQWG